MNGKYRYHKVGIESTCKMIIRFLTLLTICCSFVLCSQSVDPLTVNGPQEFILKQEQWVDSIYNELSLEEKIGQLFVPMVFSEDDKQYQTTLELIRDYNIGGIIFSRGGPIKQSKWLNTFQENSRIPLLVAMDAEWGVGMRLDSVIDFPWAMTLGAIEDLDLIEELGYRMGQQEKRLGVHLSYGPVLDVNTNPDNPIIGNRSFGESKERVTLRALAYMNGHHRSGILTTGKHFPGHGDTDQDSHLTLPTISLSKERISEVELYPYRELIEQGLSAVMVAHLNIPSLVDSILPASLSRNVVTDLLIKDLDFRGLIVTDALNMKGVTQYASSSVVDKVAFLAGHDMLLISKDIPKGIEVIRDAIKSNEISEDRLAHSVKKILKAKYKVGLHEYQPVDTANLIEDLNSSEDLELNRQALLKAMTLVKNVDDQLPLSENQKIGYLKLGDASNVAFVNQLSKYVDIESIAIESVEEVLNSSNSFDKLIISHHKSDHSPYVNYRFSDDEINAIDVLSKKFDVVLCSFTSPYSLGALKSPEEIESIILGYQNSDEAQILLVDALMGYNEVKGRLPVTPSRFFEVGQGIDLRPSKYLPYGDPDELGFVPAKFQAIDSLAQVAIDSLMTPGMQVIVAKNGKIAYQKSYGHHTYDKKISVQNHHLYDLASLTKILVSLPLVMMQYEAGNLGLDSNLNDLLPGIVPPDKKSITLKALLSHNAGLKSWIPFYRETLDTQGKPNQLFYGSQYSQQYPHRITENLYLIRDYPQKVMEMIYDSSVNSSPRYNYSDLGYYILMDYFQRYYDLSFDQIASDFIFSKLNLSRTSYNPLTKYSSEEIVPSEVDTYFRYDTIDGYVHDMGAALMDGVGGHAGLFSNAKEVASIMQVFLRKGLYFDGSLFGEETFDDFNYRYYTHLNNRRALGFDKKSLDAELRHTADSATDSSFGHYGFTGTMAWADPNHGLVFVILTNRTYPTQENRLFIKHRIRPRMHQLVYDALID